MRPTKLALLIASAVALLSVLPVGSAAAQEYPTRPIQLVIPYPPGGSDALGRKIAAAMAPKLGQEIVILNVPGASTQTASRQVAAAAPDGHTLYMPSPHELASGPAKFKDLKFDAIKDFTPISYVAHGPYALLSSAKLPPRNYKDLVAYLKANKDKVRFGSYGKLSQSDLIARRFNKETGLDIQIIPYNGGAPAFNALLADEVQMVFGTLIPTQGFIRDGVMIPMAMTSDERVPLLPQVPTMKEMGVNLVDLASFGLIGPKGLPKPIVDKLNKTLVEALKEPELKKFIESLGVIVVASSPEDYTRRITEETNFWVTNLPQFGIQPQ